MLRAETLGHTLILAAESKGAVVETSGTLVVGERGADFIYVGAMGADGFGDDEAFPLRFDDVTDVFAPPTTMHPASATARRANESVLLVVQSAIKAEVAQLQTPSYRKTKVPLNENASKDWKALIRISNACPFPTTTQPL